jgi:hypothetical protein
MMKGLWGNASLATAGVIPHIEPVLESKPKPKKRAAKPKGKGKKAA